MLTTFAAALLSAAPAAPTTPIIDTDRTMADQPLAVPPGPLRVVATRTVLPAGATIPTHMHFWSRYVYVESGEVQLTLTGSGTTRTYRAGEMIVEPLGKWHSGRIVRDTVLVATEQVPPGRCNTIRPPRQALRTIADVIPAKAGISPRPAVRSCPEVPASAGMTI